MTDTADHNLTVVEARTVAAQVRAIATRLETYLAAELGQKGDYSSVRHLRSLAERITEDIGGESPGVADGPEPEPAPDVEVKSGTLAAERWSDDEG